MRTDPARPRLSVGEIFGVSPVPTRLREAALALRGDPFTPASRFDRTSLGIMRPSLSARMWLGVRRSDRRVPIYNYFNRTQTPIAEGWSVRVTQVRDWRGGRHTYDSHNGTDFAVPVGTVVVAAAPGRVARVSSEFNRGGLKVFVDHGHGLFTTSNHLSRALVEVGQPVRRGEPIALSGASGLDMVAMFPWSTPHVHFNVWLDGIPVDPFAEPGEVALWRAANAPVPSSDPEDDALPEPTEWNLDEVARTIDECRDPALREVLRGTTPVERRAADTLFHRNYYPTRFGPPRALYARTHERRPLLDLPLRAEDYVGIIDEDGA